MKVSLRMMAAACVAVVVLVAAPLATAKEKEKSAAKSTNETKVAKVESNVQHAAYLGVGVEPLHPAFAFQMPGVFSEGQGLMVVDVMSNSPAETAGIKAHDVLVTYGDQKLFSPEQLAKLVRADKAGQEVTLGVIREGKTEQVKVTLGEREAPHAVAESQAARPWRWTWRAPERFIHRLSPSESDKRWDSFDSMTIHKLDHNRFKVEVQYLGKDDKMERHEFEGTRAEIKDAIDAEKDLPANERAHLLRSLDLPERGVDLSEFDAVPGQPVFAWPDAWFNF